MSAFKTQAATATELALSDGHSIIAVFKLSSAPSNAAFSLS